MATVTKNMKDLVKVSAKMADNWKDQFDQEKDLKVGLAAIKAYTTSISGSKAMILYKRLTGKPSKIEFLE